MFRLEALYMILALIWMPMYVHCMNHASDAELWL